MSQEQAERVAPYRLIGLGTIPWHGPWRNRQHLLSRMAVRRPVLYTNGPPFAWDIRRGDFKLSLGHIRVDGQTKVDTAPFLPPRWPRFRSLDRLALDFHARRWVRLVGHPDLPLVALLFDPQYFPFIEYLRPDVVAYHAYDLLEHMPGWSPDLEAAEHALLQRSQVRTASSQATCDRLSERSGCPVTWLSNGVDMEVFKDAAIDSPDAGPSDVIAVPRPRFGWIGGLRTGIDFGLVAKLATMRPDFHFVFMGPGPWHLSESAAADYQKLRACENVRFLPPRSMREAARAMHCMDANIMIYCLDEGMWTQAGQPLKLYEYLAAGRPIVSTPIPSALPFAEEGLIKLAHDLQEWIAALESCTRGETPDIQARRREAAAAHDWHNRVECLDQMIIGALPATKPIGATRLRH